jgi:hypothetical protein
MRDGEELAKQIGEILPRQDFRSRLSKLVSPYLQVVAEGAVCEHTGFSLMQIWRYFRHTWASPYRSVPGRSLMFLVRDAAAPYHPVIGIIALASSAVQIGVRDEWIGWNPEKYIELLRENATTEQVRWLESLVQSGLDGLYLDDFLDPNLTPLTRSYLKNPNPEIMAWFLNYAAEKRKDHYDFVNTNEHKKSSIMQVSDSAEKWKLQAETSLFRSKRAETLALLLRARMALGVDGRSVTPDELRTGLANPEKRQAIQSLIRRAKSERVGISMADVSVCGAIAPYATLLGGKLVAMITGSPEVIQAYEERYAAQESIIASSLAGKSVVRSSKLVFLCTTSLYGTEPTQYTRVSVPCEYLGGRGGESLRYYFLGRTQGFGTLHFSDQTVDVLCKKDRKVHYLFGEGVSPKLRKIRDGLDRLGLNSEQLLSHGSSRLVYGVPLARNFRDYLIGLDSEPEYLVPLENPQRVTAKIAEWWIERWLANRVKKPEVLLTLSQQRLTYPIHHPARVVVPTEIRSLELPFNSDGN